MRWNSNSSSDSGGASWSVIELFGVFFWCTRYMYEFISEANFKIER